MVIATLCHAAVNATMFLSVVSQLAAAWMKRRLSVTNLSLENNFSTFQLNTPAIIRTKVVCRDDHWSIYSNFGKLFSELKLVTDNLLFMCYNVRVHIQVSWKRFSLNSTQTKILQNVSKLHLTNCSKNDKKPNKQTKKKETKQLVLNFLKQANTEII